MTGVIDSGEIAGRYLDWVRRERERLPFTPGLAALTLKPTANPDSVKYRDMILKDAASLGVRAQGMEALSEEQLLRSIADLNRDSSVQGIVVLYPLGSSKPEEEIMDLVSPLKDVEGLHSLNLGYLIKFKRFLDEAKGLKCVVPATAKAVVKTLQHYPEIRIPGSFVAIVNNSMRVGKPLGLMLENLGATVVKCYDRTRREDLSDCVHRADIVVTAVPDPSFRLDWRWIKEGAAVIDVSYQGNIDVAPLKGRARLVSSPTNRVGKMTRAMMFVNLIYCSMAQAYGGE